METVNIWIQNEILNFLKLDDIIKLYTANPKYIEALSSLEFYKMTLDYDRFDESETCKRCHQKKIISNKYIEVYATLVYRIYSHLYKLDYGKKSKKQKKEEEFKFVFRRYEFLKRNHIRITFCMATSHGYSHLQCLCNGLSNTFRHMVCPIDKVSCKTHQGQVSRGNVKDKISCIKFNDQFKYLNKY